MEQAGCVRRSVALLQGTAMGSSVLLCGGLTPRLPVTGASLRASLHLKTSLFSKYCGLGDGTGILPKPNTLASVSQKGDTKQVRPGARACLGSRGE